MDRQRMSPSRQLMGLAIGKEDLWALFASSVRFDRAADDGQVNDERLPDMITLPVLPDIPPEAHLRGVYWDNRRNSLCLIFEHGSFPVVRPGEMIPFFNDERRVCITLREYIRREDPAASDIREARRIINQNWQDSLP